MGDVCTCKEGRSHYIGYGKWDDLAVGEVLFDGLDEIVYAREDDGMIIIFWNNGSMAQNFSSVYSRRDKLAIADLGTDTLSEILIANHDDGMVYIYKQDGYLQRRFNANYVIDSAFAVGDVFNDERPEIIIANPTEHMIYFHDHQGNWITAETLDWRFKGTRCHGHGNYHDAFVLADLVGNKKKEIVILLNSSNKSTVYDSNMNPLFHIPIQRYTVFDRVGSGDIIGDEKDELLVAVDNDGAIYVYDISGLIKVNYFPWTDYDTLNAGDLLSEGKDELVVAQKGNGMLSIEYGDDAPLGGVS